MLAHDAFGRDADPAVVLLHGWPLDRGIWSEVAPRLADARVRVLCVDVPGLGRSAPLPAARWTVEDYAEEVAAILREGRTARCAVAGHSFGGYVALALAERHPDLVAGLALVSSRTLADTEAGRRGRRETIEKVRSGGSRVLLPDLAKKLLAPSAPEALVERAASVIERAPSDGVIAGLAAMSVRPDRTAILESFPGPILVLHGGADQLIPVEEAARPSRPGAAVTRRILEGVGHLPMWEAASETTEAIAGWARSAHGR
jgi:pimeloyl-ACP methyl ester carboxylesterase